MRGGTMLLPLALREGAGGEGAVEQHLRNHPLPPPPSRKGRGRIWR
jgi:hypothetical protein